MTDDELRAVKNTLVTELAPIRDLAAGLLTIMEDLVRRVEVLELEQQHRRASPEHPF